MSTPKAIPAAELQAGDYCEATIPGVDPGRGSNFRRCTVAENVGHGIIRVTTKTRKGLIAIPVAHVFRGWRYEPDPFDRKAAP